jgi:hypothetical protein
MLQFSILQSLCFLITGRKTNDPELNGSKQDWSALAEYMDRWQAPVNMVMYLRIP